LPYKISKIIGEHTCEGKSKDKSIGWADNLQQYYGCLVNFPVPHQAISENFLCNGEKILLDNRAIGFFKPTIVTVLLIGAILFVSRGIKSLINQAT
jgi:hypothetical protein